MFVFGNYTRILFIGTYIINIYKIIFYCFIWYFLKVISWTSHLSTFGTFHLVKSLDLFVFGEESLNTNFCVVYTGHGVGAGMRGSTQPPTACLMPQCGCHENQHQLKHVIVIPRTTNFPISFEEMSLYLGKISKH